VATFFQLVPSQCSASGSLLSVLTKTSPTIQAFDRDSALTPASVSSAVSAGMLTCAHRVPFHRTTVPVPDTAQASDAESALTASKAFPGAGTRSQVEPFQCRARLSLPLGVSNAPTAHASEADTALTPDRTVPMVPPGLGLATRLQPVPLQRNIIVCGKPAAVVKPTAQAFDADVALTLSRKPWRQPPPRRTAVLERGSSGQSRS
jgi:hypothetical protein